ncbi:MAG: DUF1127 domain-containing protein [Hyphomicrobiaceae bacterium]
MIMTSGMTRGSVPAISPPWPAQTVSPWLKARRFLQAALSVAGERRRLAALDDRMLKDIGLSRSLAEREVARDFFDVPGHRIRRR